MTSTLENTFSPPVLSGKVEAFANDANMTMVFEDKFRRGRELSADLGGVKWDEIRFGQGLAPVVGMDGKAKQKAPVTKVARTSHVMAVKRSVLLNPSRVWRDRAPGELAPDAMQYVEAEARDLVNEIKRTIAYACAETLRGTLTVNSTNIPGSSQSFTLTYSPNTYTKSAGWGTASTGILSSELPALKIDHRRSAGFEAKQAIIGSTVEGYMLGNTEVTGFASYALGERFVTQSATMEGAMLGGLEVGGLRWHVTESGYIPDGGSFTRYLPTTDQAIVLPGDEMLPDVLGMAEAYGLIPVKMLGNASEAAELVRPAPTKGWCSYAVLDPRVPTVELFVCWYGLPVLMRPAAVTVADCN